MSPKHEGGDSILVTRQEGGDEGEEADGEEAEHPDGEKEDDIIRLRKRFSQDRFPPGGAHDEGSNNVGRDLDQGDQRRVHMGTSGQVELLLIFTFHKDFSVLTSMPKMVP